ncbi:MAG: CapA family protein [Lachnospiraceae bacterium]
MKIKQSKTKKTNLFKVFAVSLTSVLLLGGIAFTAYYMMDKGCVTQTETIVLDGVQTEPLLPLSVSSNVSVKEDTSKYGAVLTDAERMKTDHIYAKTSKVPGQTLLAFGGDVMFDDSYSIMNSYHAQGDDIKNCIGDTLLQEMQAADILMLNNECTFTTRGEPTPNKQYTFRAKPEYTAILQDMGVDLVSIANNHVYDYGEISLLDTLTALDGADIRHVGAGTNLSEARQPIYYIINDRKIAFVSATQIERLPNPDTVGATKQSAGVFRCLDPNMLCETLREAKSKSDYVVLYIHWGTENVTEIDWAQRDHSALYAEAGADVIIGDHPHCLQGITYIGDTPVIYSVGNFWFNSRTIDTGLFTITLDEKGTATYRFVPCIQSSCRTSLLQGAEKERVLQHMRELSPGVLIGDDGTISTGTISDGTIS